MPNRVCQINARSGLACGWLILFSNAIANAFKAGFHLVARGARPCLAGRGVPVTERGVLGPGIAPEPADRRVLRGPPGLEFPQPFTGSRFGRGGVNGLEIPGTRPGAAGRLVEGVADQMDHARLDRGLPPTVVIASDKPFSPSQAAMHLPTPPLMISVKTPSHYGVAAPAPAASGPGFRGCRVRR